MRTRLGVWWRASRSLAPLALSYLAGLVVVTVLVRVWSVHHPQPWGHSAVTRRMAAGRRDHHLGKGKKLMTDGKGAQSGEQRELPRDFRSSNEKVKLILYWNPFFMAEDFRFGFGRQPFLEAGCPVNTCYTTMDRGLWDSADALLTHGPVVEPPPPNPKPNQRYVFVQGEPHWVISNDLLPALEGLYNLTMTYRVDSDIRLPYAFVEKDSRKPHRLEPYEVDTSSKTRSVVWVVSHCDTPSKREVYARELMKHIDVDVYGACGTLECAKSHKAECRDMFASKYHFYLSMENDVCLDYASEKLYHPLRYDIVPVAYGGANYSLDTPPKSVIDIMDYPDPRKLANYLKYLIQNKPAYQELFRWKNQGYGIEMDRRTIMARAMCRLCQILHDTEYKYRDYRDIWKWWTDGTCDANAMAKLKKMW